MSVQRERWFYLLITPWLIGFVLFHGGPILGALALALVEWRLPQPPQFVGLEHLRRLWYDPLLGRTLFNTSYYTLGTVPFSLALGLGLAILLNRRERGVAFFRAVFFLPVVVSGVAMTLLWAWIFNPQHGPLNALLGRIGINSPGWLQDEQWAMPTLILISLWGVGVNMLVYLAALQQTPAELLEAAALDGANRWQRFGYIVWPLLTPVTLYLLVVNVIGAFQVFTPTYILTRGGPNNATLTLPLYIYLNAFAWSKLGYAAAVGVVLLLLVLAVTFVQFRLASRWVFYLGSAA